MNDTYVNALRVRFALFTDDPSPQVLALSDMGVTVPDLQMFRDGAEEETFAHDVPPFPIERQKAAAPSFSQRGEVWIHRPVTVTRPEFQLDCAL